jgi:hypothetical protein
VHIDLFSLLEQVTHHLESSSSLHHKVLIIHVQNGVLLVSDVTLLADELDVVRRQTVLVEILLTLYGEDGRNVIFLQFEDVGLGFGVAAHIDLGSDLREDYLVDTELIHNDNLSAGVCHLDPVLLRRLLIVKLEHPPRLSLTLHLTILLDIQIEKLLLTPIGIESIEVHFLLRILPSEIRIILLLQQGEALAVGPLHLLLFLPIS